MADKAMVEDFTDVGTWRLRGGAGFTPGTWFAADQSLHGAPCKDRVDGYAGIIDFNFTGKPPYYAGFVRNKVTLKASAFADAISFYMNPLGRNVRIWFLLEDANRKKFSTRKIKIDSNCWKEYRIPIDKKNVKNFDKIEQPVTLKKVYVQLEKPGSGKVLIDDIALCGDVSRKQRLTILPIYNGISHAPGKDVSLAYRLRNGMNQKVTVQVDLQVFDFFDNKIATVNKIVSIDPSSINSCSFDIGKLEIGAYYTKVSIKYKKINNFFEGWFGVFQPNGKRVNTSPMYFGVQDTTTWNGKHENRLHLSWLKALGIDVVRYGSGGSRVQPKENVFGFKSLAAQLKQFYDNNILVCFSYTEATPAFLQNPPRYYRRMPDKLDKFAKHIAALGKFLKQYPNVKYFEWWNEPDIGFFKDSLENYMKCLKIVYSTLKKTDSQIKVTTGGVTVIHPREKKNFSRNMYWHGKGFYDIASFHAHGSYRDYIVRNNKVEKWLNQKNIKVALCNTEAGERSGYRIPSIKRQAEVLVKRITFAKSRNTEFYLWFTLQDYWDMDEVADDSFGLVTCDNQPKPSFIAYNNLIKQLANTTPDKPYVLDQKLETFHFRNNRNEHIFVAWPKITGNAFAFNLKTSTPVVFSDIFGRETVLSPKNGIIDISVNKYPFFLRVPSGHFVHRVNLVSCASNIFAAPGAMAKLKIKISNPWKTQIECRIASADDAKVLKILLLPETTKSLVLEHFISPKSLLGPMIVKFNASLKGKGIFKKFDFPVTVNIAYPVEREGKKNSSIMVSQLGNVRELSYDPAIPRWSGKKDLSVEMTMIRKEKGLLAKFEVNDNKHLNRHSGQDIWKGDSVQLAIMSMTGELTELTIAKTNSGAQVWCHVSSNKKYLGRWNVPLKIERQSGKTIYEVLLPYASLKIKNVSGARFRFSFLVNEDDGLGRVRWIEMFGGIGSAKDPDQFGWAFFK
jgi:hypothetical protein